MPRAGLLALGLMLCSACVAATDTSANETETETGAADAQAATEMAAAAAEQLIAQPPKGWRRTGTTDIGNLRRAEYIPDDELEDAWTRRITFESMQEDPLPDPIEFIELMNSGKDYACGTFRSYPTFSGLENGYPTSVYLLVCHMDRSTERSEVSMIKTIQGNDYFYVITRAMRGDPIPKDEAPPIEETEIGGWAVFMKSISVCDPSRAAAHPCPDPAG